MHGTSTTNSAQPFFSLCAAMIIPLRALKPSIISTSRRSSRSKEESRRMNANKHDDGNDGTKSFSNTRATLRTARRVKMLFFRKPNSKYSPYFTLSRA